MKLIKYAILAAVLAFAFACGENSVGGNGNGNGGGSNDNGSDNGSVVDPVPLPLPGTNDIYAGTNDGVYKLSADRLRWEKNMATTGEWRAFAKAADGSILGATNGQGIWKTVDGTNWMQTSKMDGEYLSLIKLNNGIMLSGGNNYGHTGVWKSVDNGTIWERTSKNGGFPVSFIEHPNGSVYMGDKGLGGNPDYGVIYKSINNGDSWSQIGNIYGKLRSLIFLKDHSMLACGDYGVFKQGIEGNPWIRQDNAPSGRSLCLLHTGRVLLGSYSEGILYSDDNGTSWNRTNKTDGAWSSFSIEPNGVILAGSGINQGIWYSSDNGITWNPTNKTTGDVYALFSND